MFRHSLAAILLLCWAVPTSPQTQHELVGRIEAELVPDWLESSVAVTRVEPSKASATLGELRPAGASVWGGEFQLRGQGQPIYLMESAPGQFVALADLNGDKKLSKEECVSLSAATKDDWRAVLATTLLFATPSAAFPGYPVRVGLSEAPKADAPKVYLRVSLAAFVAGTVMIDGKQIMLRVPVGRKSLAVTLSQGYQYLDCNDDGRIDFSETSPEMGHAEDAPVVFHVGTGDRYVSIERLDLAKKTVTLVLHPASDYERIELLPGRLVPDFQFTALDGSLHRLSEFRGRYLLLDFWGTWCGPCVSDIPAIKKAYEAYQAKGFDVLGMDSEMPDETAADFEQGLAKAKAFVAERGLPWMQARTESIKRLYQRRFMIVSYPTYVLLNPEGVIVAVNKGLRGEELDKTLAALFKDK